MKLGLGRSGMLYLSFTRADTSTAQVVVHLNPDSTMPTLSDMLVSSKMWRLAILTALNRFVMALRLVALPLFVLFIGSDEAFYGLLVAGAGYAEAIFLFPSGTVSDKKGRGTATLLGGVITGSTFFVLPFVDEPALLLLAYCITGIGDGFMVTSVEALIADHSRSDVERTKSYGFTITIATLAATVGPFVGGYLLSQTASPWISPAELRYIVVFFMMGGARFAAGLLGFHTERWLIRNEVRQPVPPEQFEPAVIHTSRADSRTALLFGMSQLIMGIASGMVVPYLIPWINARFGPDELLLGSVPAVANLTLASGTLLVGLVSERVGKIRTMVTLYLVTPILAYGLVTSLGFVLMAAFYVIREAVANMAKPATSSLFMGEVSRSRRGRLWAVTTIMWTIPRQTGTLLASLILGAAIFPSIVEFGVVVFPLAMCLYPLSAIPMYVAVRMNRKESYNRAEDSQG